MYKREGFRGKVVCVIVSTFLIFMFADQLLLVDLFSYSCPKTTMADFPYISLKPWKIDKNHLITTYFYRLTTLGNLESSKNLDCKTVRIFAYSSTLEQSTGTRLKTESETGERLKSANIQRTLLLFGLFLKLKKSTFQEKRDLWCADEAFRIILLQRGLQRHNKFCGVIIFS